MDKMREFVKKAYIDAEKLRKGLIRSPKSSVKKAREIEGALKSALKAGARGAAMKGGNAPKMTPIWALRGGNAPKMTPIWALRGGNAPGIASKR